MENENKIENSNQEVVQMPVPEVQTEANTEIQTEISTEIQSEVATEVQTIPASNVIQEVSSQPVVASPEVGKTEPQVQVIMQEGEKKKEKKKLDKQTLIRIIAGSVILLGIAIYFIFFNKTEKPTDDGDPQSVTTAYFNYLINRNYSSAQQYALIPEGSFVSEDDFFSYMSSNKSYSNLYNKTIKEVRKSSKTETNAKYEVTLNDDTKYTVNLSMQSDGSWKIIHEDLYLENWMVEVPGSSKLYIDGTLVPKTLAKLNDKDHDVYTIPAIAPYKKEFKVVTQFGEITKKIGVASSSSGDEIKLELTKEDEINSALEYIKEMWNGLYKDYIDGTSNDEVLKKYYDSNFKVTDMPKVYKEYFDKLSGKGNKQYTYKDVELEDVIVNPDKKQMVEADDIISIEFGYKYNLQ